MLKEKNQELFYLKTYGEGSGKNRYRWKNKNNKNAITKFFMLLRAFEILVTFAVFSKSICLQPNITFTKKK